MQSHFCKLAKSQWAKAGNGCLQFTQRTLCSGSKEGPQIPESTGGDAAPPPKIKGGFAEAMAKFEGHENFTKMLRKSAFVQVLVAELKYIKEKVKHFIFIITKLWIRWEIHKEKS